MSTFHTSYALFTHSKRLRSVRPITYIALLKYLTALDYHLFLYLFLFYLPSGCWGVNERDARTRV